MLTKEEINWLSKHIEFLLDRDNSPKEFLSFVLPIFENGSKGESSRVSESNALKQNDAEETLERVRQLFSDMIKMTNGQFLARLALLIFSEQTPPPAPKPEEQAKKRIVDIYPGDEIRYHNTDNKEFITVKGTRAQTPPPASKLEEQAYGDLLPCPFCKDASNAYLYERLSFEHEHRWAVLCAGGCGHDGPAKPTKQEAITAWNTRARRQ